jgi:hypothetical protein
MIGITNAGGSGAGCKLTVTAPVGAAITVTNTAGKVKSKTVGANGLAVFRGLTEGKWTITISNSTDTASKTVEIKADYQAEITFFSATINITYPAGLVCTATNGSTTLNAPDTSGTWACAVTEAGEWTVKLSTGFAEKVTVGASGESHTVNKWYLYKNGDKRTDVTGGWSESKAGNGKITWDTDNVRLYYAGTSARFASIYTAKKMQIMGWSKLCTKVSVVFTNNADFHGGVFGISNDAYLGASNAKDAYAYMVAATRITKSLDDNTIVSTDISKAQGGDYVVQIVASTADITIHEIYLEV